MKYTIEIAVTDYHTASAAVEGGADRIELCTALSEGGLTPPASLIRLCRERFSLPLFPIIRPREGDFLYGEDEFSMMMKDIELCRSLGCDGVVLGALQEDGRVDKAMSGRLREIAYPMDVTFHRAFDRCLDPFGALETLIQLGFQRILTSGQQLVASDGISLLKDLVTQAGDRISIMPGSGVRPDTIGPIARETGATEFHASLRSKEKSRMKFIRPAFEHTDDYLLPSITADHIVKLKMMLQ